MCVLLLLLFARQLILSLEKRLMELNETLQKVRDGFMEKSADLEALQRTADDQVRWCTAGVHNMFLLPRVAQPDIRLMEQLLSYTWPEKLKKEKSRSSKYFSHSTNNACLYHMKLLFIFKERIHGRDPTAKCGKRQGDCLAEGRSCQALPEVPCASKD